MVWAKKISNWTRMTVLEWVVKLMNSRLSWLSWKTYLNFHGNVSFTLAHLRMGHGKTPAKKTDIISPVNWSSHIFQWKIIIKYKCIEVNITIMIYSWKLVDKSICIYQQVGFWNVFGDHFLKDVVGFLDQYHKCGHGRTTERLYLVFFFCSVTHTISFAR